MDFITYGLSIILVSIIAWLSNLEIKKCREQFDRSEIFFNDNRVTLEKIIKRRTDELLMSEKTRNAELQKSAQFGELSQGLFHDLMNPLSSLSLYIENLKIPENISHEAKDMVNRAISASRRMESFMNSVRHASAKAVFDDNQQADLLQEITTVFDILAYKAKIAGITLECDDFQNEKINIHPIRLHQIFMNLISNALDACLASTERYRAQNSHGHIMVIVENTSSAYTTIKIKDNGCGISQDNIIQTCKYPFTTKIHGTGIGLITVKKIIDQELLGSISFSSQENVGTVFTITVPKNQNIANISQNNAK